MRVLFLINTGLIGGLQRHVLCLMAALKGVADTAVAINTELEPQIIDMFADKGMKVYRLQGRSGHDWRIVGRFQRTLKDFKPDIIHAHGVPLLVLLYLSFISRKTPVIHSLHTPPRKPSKSQWLPWKLLEWRVTYWLPVSSITWERFRKWHPSAKGEVFFNPIKVGSRPARSVRALKDGALVVGMVGRNADQKDWPSFHKVEQLVRDRMPDVSFLNAGEETICDGRAAIASMDLFVMTSKHEQLPTTMLECFALGTPICGFLPDGGTKDVLAFSDGSVSSAFIESRDCKELAKLVEALLCNAERRNCMIEDGWNILSNHFDADKNCRGQLMNIYRRFAQ